MKIDTGLAIVILAVLVFYLRLIIIQRERAKRAKTITQSADKKGARGNDKKGTVTHTKPAIQNFSILSNSRLDRIIGFTGAGLILIGVGLNLGIIPPPVIQNYWWIPTALGIIAFSWAFKL